jgi:hypothetical protein
VFVRPRLAIIFWVACIATTGIAAGQGDRAGVKVTMAARALQPGEVVVLTVTTPASVESVRVRIFERELQSHRIGPNEWQVLAGIDLDTAPGRYQAEIVAGPPDADPTVYGLTVIAKASPQRELKVDDAFVNPPADVVSRIVADAERLTRVWTGSSPSRLWNGPFARPVSEPANSAFGARSVFNGQLKDPHSGADFGSVAGTPVHAPNAGTVVLADDLYFTGNTVVIDHGLGLFSLFAHLRSMAVREGESVSTRQLIGEVGATGRVTGPHLHWSVRANGARVDPMSLLAVQVPGRK